MKKTKESVNAVTMSGKAAARQLADSLDKNKEARKQRRRAAKLAGAMLGGYVAGPFGAKLGAMAGGTIARITGFGDYQVSSNVLANKAMVLRDDQSPSFNVKGGVTTITHREYIGDVRSLGSAFNIAPYRVNPGDPTAFPWLYQIARKFQKYRFKGLVFEFRTMSSEYASGSALGTVILASNYNAGDLGYTSKIQMENSAFATSCKPSMSMMHPIECAANLSTQGWFYTRDGSNPVVAAQFYDTCNTYLGMQGISAPLDTVLGELWATYVVELLEPIIAPDVTPVTTGVSWAGKTFSGTFFQGNIPFAPVTLAFGPGILPTLSSDNGAPALVANMTLLEGAAVPSGYNFWGAIASGAPAPVYTGNLAAELLVTTSSSPDFTSTGAQSSRLYFKRPGKYVITTFQPRNAAAGSGFVVTAGGAAVLDSTFVGNNSGGAVFVQYAVTVPTYAGLGAALGYLQVGNVVGADMGINTASGLKYTVSVNVLTMTDV